MVRPISALSLLKTTSKSALCALLFLLGTPWVAAEAIPPYTGPIVAGQLAEPKNLEASGLAASHRTPGLLWTHNDSGGAPLLFALNADGSPRGRVRVAGVTNDDWEDIASFELDGKAWLLVADIGDNFSVYTRRVLHLIAEPDAAALAPGRELVLQPEYSIYFSYEDGPRDAESLAVDVTERAVYVLSKRESQPRLYRLPLVAAPASQPVLARFLTNLPHLPQPTALQRNLRMPTQGFRGWPTAMGFSPDRTAALVLVYGDLLLFPRAAGESWADALAREPAKLGPFRLPQAEGACFTSDGRAIFVCSEQTMTLLRYDRR